jgi:hypothetical protein
MRWGWRGWRGYSPSGGGRGNSSVTPNRRRSLTARSAAGVIARRPACCVGGRARSRAKVPARSQHASPSPARSGSSPKPPHRRRRTAHRNLRGHADGTGQRVGEQRIPFLPLAPGIGSDTGSAVGVGLAERRVERQRREHLAFGGVRPVRRPAQQLERVLFAWGQVNVIVGSHTGNHSGSTPRR